MLNLDNEIIETNGNKKENSNLRKDTSHTLILIVLVFEMRLRQGLF